ncbi:MAG: hypothetical protein NTX92_09340, partial [Euryarchaeota archaeon]|nr:hypothetical protein [Euryarchaeota archaeon]
YVFCCIASGILPERYRFSSALIGDSSEGKTNMEKTTSKYFPDGICVNIGRITGACVEDDIDPYKTVIFQELNDKATNAQIIEYAKHLTEDGLDVMKKDLTDNFKSTVKKRVERKAGVYTSTSNTDNDELQTRYSLIPVVGFPAKYHKINERTKEDYSDPTKTLEKMERETKSNWITEGLKTLKNFDIISIPYAEIIEVIEDSPRCMRDLKRFLNLICVIAWLHQKNRRTETIKGKNGKEYQVIYASPEDYYNAYEIGERILSQSYTNLDERSLQTLKAIIKISKEHGKENLKLLDEEENYKEYLWVDRTDVQKEIGLKSANGMKKRLKALIDLDLIRIHAAKNSNKCYISLVTELITYLSSTPLLPITKSFFTKTNKQLYKEIVTGELRVNDGSVTGPVTGQKTSLLSIKDMIPITKIEKRDSKLDNYIGQTPSFPENSDGSMIKTDTIEGAETQ